ncbi:MAG TPA: peptidoglycan binding domain-containing protein, partial [Chloroflexota bacterium]|nr:peptidoglycan binding domain-containing protein [Chloroflexota bacterium]
MALDSAYQNRALPGVRYGTLSFSGLSEHQVRGLIDVHATPLLASPVVFYLGDREWRPSATEIGLAIDSAAMAREALAVRQAVPPVLRLPHALMVRVTRPAVGLQATINESQLGAFLSAVAAEVDKAPVNAALSVKDGELVVGPSAEGVRVNIPATIKRVQRPGRLDEPQRVEVATDVVAPALPDASITEARATAAKILAAPLVAKVDTRTWTLSPADLGKMLDIKPSGTTGEGGHEQLVVSLNEPKVAAFVRTIASQVDRPPVDAQLRWSGSGVVVTRESQEGLKLEQGEAVKAIMAQAALPEREVVLRTVVAKPQVSSENIPSLGITQLLATGTSKFTGSPPERVNNI